MDRCPTILFNAPNRIGLGHINRLANIAQKLRDFSPSIRVPFLIEGAAHVLLDSRQLPYLPLPSSRAISQCAVWGAWEQQERLNLQRQIVRSSIDTLRPDMLVFDCFPSYAFALEMIGFGKPIVLCLREMKQLDMYVQAFKELLAFVDLILIPHLEGSFTLPPALAKKSTFVGIVARSIRPRPPAREPPAAGTVVITGGGGGYPETVHFYNMTLRAWSLVRHEHPGLEAILVTGPLFNEWLDLDLAEGVRVIPYVPDLLEVFESAELVISQGGYNTIAELDQVGCRIVCVPAPRYMDDQFARVASFAERCPNVLIYRGSDVTHLAGTISRSLRSPAEPVAKPKHQGADMAARCLLNLV